MAGKKGSSGAPKGNKNAVGNSGGPRKYDVEAEAADLLKWSEREDAVEILDWVNPKEFIYETAWEWSKSNIEFAKAYNKAKQRIASRLSKKAADGSYYFGVYNRMIRCYDTRLTNYEKAHAEFESKLKKDEEKAKGPVVINSIDYSKVKTD